MNTMYLFMGINGFEVISETSTCLLKTSIAAQFLSGYISSSGCINIVLPMGFIQII